MRDCPAPPLPRLQDLEAAVETVPGVRPGCVAAFQAPVTGGSGEGDGAVVVAEVRDAAQTAASLTALAGAVRAAVMSLHAVALDAVVLLRPHCARKVWPAQGGGDIRTLPDNPPLLPSPPPWPGQTTSGKIARSWNRRAFLELQAGDAASPWLTRAGAGGAQPPVLLLWLPRQAGGADVAEAGDVALSAASPTPAPAAPPRGGGGGDGTPSEALEGAALLAALRREVGLVLRADPEGLDAERSLQDLGMDSLSIAQLAGALTHKYGLRVRDDALFADSTSLAWLVRHAAQLRRGEEPPSAEPRRSGAAAAGLADAPAGGELGAVASGGTGGGSGRPTRSVVEVDPSVMAGARHRGGGGDGGRRRPGWFEQNCPCCMWCC